MSTWRRCIRAVRVAAIVPMAADAVPAAPSPSPESVARLATLLDNLPGMAYRCRHDEHWTMEYVSAGSRELTGYAPGDLCDNRAIRFEQLIHPEDRSRVREAVAAALAQGGRFALDYRLVTAGGAVRWVRSHGAGVAAAGAGPRCLEGFLTDITEWRQADERQAEVEAQMRQNQKLEALGTLAGGIAHDFNNILTAIIVNQELAQMDLHEPADLSRRLAEIGAASGRAKELVRQILTFSRQQPHARLRQRLQMIVREALGLLRASLPATIEIVQEISPAAPPVLADASQIHQVVMNLCTNAAHAMRRGPGRLTVRLAACVLDEAACRARPGLRPGPHAQLTVADTGHGMDAAVLARIFEPFFTTKGPGEGTGLGLAVVHGIIRDHGGAITVQSRPGEGTTFDLYLPESGDPAGTATATEAAIVPGRGEAVLVVDDEEAIGQAIGAMLRRIGYRVQTFTDPRVALEQFRAAPADCQLLLTDRTMPHLSGAEVIASAREVRPGLPALMMSGLSSSVTEEREAREGRYLLVAKPIDIADLSCAVRKALAPSEASP